jgi:hypothetical protein
MAVLAISIEAAAQTLRLSGGDDLSASAEIVIPALMASALVYFLVITALVGASRPEWPGHPVGSGANRP